MVAQAAIDSGVATRREFLSGPEVSPEFLALAGPVEWAFRLPSALAASLWVWLLYRFARQEAPEIAPLAAFMLASALGPLLIARAATADALLNAFIAGALCSTFESPLRAKTETMPNLVAYAQRMMAEYFPAFAKAA